MKKLLILCGIALLLARSGARAQDVIVALDPTLMAGWAGGEAVRYDLEKRAAAAKGTRAAAATSFAYRSSPSTRARAVEQTATRLQASNAPLAQTLTATFGPGKTDFAPIYAEIISGTGLRADNAADALACYLLMGYAIVHNLQDGKAITPALAQGTRQQVMGILAGNPKLKPDDPVAAAGIGEEFKLQTVILQSGWQSAIKTGRLPAYQQSVGQLFKAQYGLDMAQLKLTSQGFAKR